jgi:virginiamycin B lyase
MRIVAVATLVALAFNGCASSEPSSTLLPAAQSPSSAAVHPDRKRTRVPITFKIDWKKKRVHRRPHYLPATARSVAITMDAGTPQYANAPTSLVYLQALPGVHTFAISAYDEQNGVGNVVAEANVTQKIAVGGDNVIAATLNGVIASISVNLSNPSPNAGVPATVAVNVTARDADGNVIVGSTSDYSSPINLAVIDPAGSGTLSLSQAVLQGPWASATLNYTGGTLSSGLSGQSLAQVVASSAGISNATAAFTPAPTFYQFSIPVAANRPQYIVAGPDGNMWFTENPGNIIGRITPAGVVTTFTIPNGSAEPQQIIAASDGNLWFTEAGSTINQIVRLTTSGTFTPFSTLFAPPPADLPQGLVDRGDGNVWYVAQGASRIGFQGITSGVAGETSVPTANSSPFGIATAPDDNLYYTESAVDKIGRMVNLFTAQTEITLTSGTVPESIVRGPDGNLWFTENGTSKIGRLIPSSFVVSGEFVTLTPNSAPTGIVVGKDNAIWYTENALDRIGRSTTGGTQSEFASPVTGLGLRGIAVAPDGSLWFAEPGTGLNPGRIGKLVY